jgi:hypothetical protein
MKSDFDDPGLIFLPVGGSGEFAEIAEQIRAAEPVPSPSVILPIQHTCVEFINVCATHLALDTMDARGDFRPLVMIPIQPFTDQSEPKTFRCQPFYRLSWYGHPVSRRTDQNSST